MRRTRPASVSARRTSYTAWCDTWPSRPRTTLIRVSVAAGACKKKAVSTASRGRVTRSAASRSERSRSAGVGTRRACPVFWNRSRLGGLRRLGRRGGLLRDGGGALVGRDVLGELVAAHVGLLGGSPGGGLGARFDLLGEVGLVHHHQAGLALVEQVAELLEVAARHPARDVAGDPADGGAPGRGGGDADADRREQRGGDADGQAPAEPDGRAA